MATDMTAAVDSVSETSHQFDSAERNSAERGAGGVVFDGLGRVLLIRHASGDWVFPKGHVEAGETELQAALREVEEEAGVRAGRLEGTGSWSTEYVNPRGVRRLITWFALHSDDPPSLSEDLFTDAAYRAPEEALSVLSHESDRRLLTAVLTEASAAVGEVATTAKESA